MPEYTRENTRALTFGERRQFQMGAPMAVKVVMVAGAGFRVPKEG